MRGLGFALVAFLVGSSAEAQGQIRAPEDLLAWDPCGLERIYRQGTVGVLPEGKVRGLALVAPGTSLAGPASKAAGLAWQGKVFHGADSSVVNRFFGLRIVRAQVTHGTSWLDGAPTIVIDYQSTSLVYARYRDELREVAPGVFLGLMFDRTAQPAPKVVRYFALDTRCAR